MKRQNQNRINLDEEIRQIQHAAKSGQPLPSRLKKQSRLIKSKLKPHTKKLAVISFALLLLLQPVIFYLTQKNDTVNALTGQADLYPDGDNTTQWWCNDVTPACGSAQAGTHYTRVDELKTETNGTKDTDFINTGTSMNGSGEIEDYTIENPTIAGTFESTTQVTVNWRGGIRGACQGSGGSPCDSVDVNIFIDGALQTAQTQALTGSTIGDHSHVFNGTWSAINDLRVRFVRTANGGGSSSAKDDDVQLSQVWLDVDYTYTKAPPELTQKAFIWEMDDAAGDGQSQLAAGNTAVTMRAGERATLRAQLRNTGGPLDIENLGLFYDRSDGMWSKVESFKKASIGSGSGCTSTDWNCITAYDEGSNQNGLYINLKLSPSGTPYFSHYDATNSSLKIAQYVGSGGSGCGASGSTAWTCTTIDADGADSTGSYSSLAFSKSGIPYVSYYDATATSLMVAQYVGSGGSGCGASGSTAWTCTTVDNTGTDLGQYTSIAFNPVTDVPYVSYYDVTNTSLRLAQYVGGTSGTGCTSTAWTCINVDADAGDNTGSRTSIAFNQAGTPYIAYNDGSAVSVMVAQYVGSSGSGCGTSGSTAWTCVTVDDPALGVGSASIAFSPSGVPYISYIYNNNEVKVAYFYSSGGGGNCNSTGGSANWQCSAVEARTSIGQASIAFSPQGLPIVSYNDSSSTSLEIAQYVGSGGDCDDTAWKCVTVDNTSNADGRYSSIVFGPRGTPMIAYATTTGPRGVKIAELHRAGEIRITPSFGGTSSLTESHADMTATDDTTNRDDADCIDTGTWNNGKAFLAEEGSGLTLADGTGTAQCTEVTWTIDTSQAVPGTTYRFVIATDDATAQSKGKWRGPIAINNYPTLTIEDDSLYPTHQTVSKDSLYTLPDCTDTDWGCEAINVTDSVGTYSSMGVDHDGMPWVAYVNSTDDSIEVARYVGSGGNCDTVGAGSDAWECYVIDDTASEGPTQPALAIGNDGSPKVSYYSGFGVNDLRFATFVGSGGNCDTAFSGSDAWNCETVDATGSVGGFTSLAIDLGGNPWITYEDNTNTSQKVARYVGSGGNCDDTGGSDAWFCETLDNGGSTNGQYSSIGVNKNGDVWVAYQGGIQDLYIAHYVGSGGDCDTVASGSDAWTCTAVDVTDSVGYYPSLAFDQNGNPWVSHHDASNTNLEVAYFVGGGSGNCNTVGAGSSDWECTIVASTGDVGRYSSIAFDASGSAWVSYYESFLSSCDDSPATECSLNIARYVSSGGTGCASAAWTCGTVSNPPTTGNTGLHTSIVFDHYGNPWISHQNSSSGDIYVAAYKGTFGAPTYQTANTPSARNGSTTYGRYPLSNGKPSSQTTNTTCTGVSDFLGLCGISQEDGQHESITAPAYHRPMFQMRARFQDNTVAPTLTWAGETSLAASTNTITLQVYRYGTTNAWETVTTNTTCAANTACALTNLPSGTVSEYYDTDGSNYWVYFRVVQAENTAGSITFKTDALRAVQPQQWMRHGRTFDRNLIQPFDTTTR